MGRVLIDTDIYLAYIFPPSKKVFDTIYKLLHDSECGEIHIPPHVPKETIRIATRHGRRNIAVRLFQEISPCATHVEYDQNTSIIAGRLLIENPEITLPQALNAALAIQYKLPVLSQSPVYEKLGIATFKISVG